MARSALLVTRCTHEFSRFNATRLNAKCCSSNTPLTIARVHVQQGRIRASNRFYSTSTRRCDNSAGTRPALVDISSVRAQDLHRHIATTRDYSDLVRILMRQVPHPVAIITSTDHTIFNAVARSSSSSPSQSPKLAEAFKGATVSSFNTVTLTPNPIISFNIKRQSSTFAALKNSTRFNVHLLNETAEAEEIASLFASGNAARPFEGLDTDMNGCRQKQKQNKHGLAAFLQQPTTIPEIEDEFSGALGPEDHAPMPPKIQYYNSQNQAAVAFQLDCGYLPDKSVTIEDHVVVFGRVLGIGHELDLGAHSRAKLAELVAEFGSGKSLKPCLTYVNGRYSRVSES